jgi:hypothetical protein
MKEKLIEFETAKLAKEKGLCNYFEDINPTNYVDAFYSEDGVEFKETEYMQEDCTIQDRYFRPAQSLLQKWLRDVHNIYVSVSFNDHVAFQYYYFIHTNVSKSYSNRICSLPFKSNNYEDALELGLQEALKLLTVN